MYLDGGVQDEEVSGASFGRKEVERLRESIEKLIKEY